ncbi:MAG TPA: hypothetical protein VFM86_09735 [Pedococcus sp.]|nr:hypothetical protein [Pedococcus sp.]
MSLIPDDAETYERLAGELIEARTAYEAQRNDLTGSALRDVEDRLNAAEQEFDEAFTETLTIEQAEALHRRLGKSITAAKINRGTFDYRDIDAF